MVATKINVSEPDFLAIRNSFKEFLKGQEEFKDYNLEGSGMAILMDVLAYNTGYMAFMANMAFNEGFSDSAVLRPNMVSRAKMLGYRPRSRRGAVAYINIEVFPTGDPDEVIVNRGTKFSSVLDGITYTFSTTNSYTLPKKDGRYLALNVPVTEGEVLRHRFTVNSVDPQQRFLLPNPGVDTTSIRVSVQESANNQTVYVYQLNSDLNVIDADSRVYFLQEVEGQRHEIYFGDGIIGKKPQHGNIVFVDYLSCHGEEANGLSVFTPQLGVGGFNTYTITTVAKSSGGASEEDIESVRFLAPLSYQMQGRAVTEADYMTLIKADYPNVDSIRVWGGEENDPPYYGKVFVAIKPLDGLVLSDQVKEHLINNVIRKRNMVSVDVDIVDPDYIRIAVSTLVKWRADRTEMSQAQVQAAIRKAIIDYGNLELDNFGTYFRYSKFVQIIDTSHPAVQNNLTSIKLKYRMATSLVTKQNYLVNFSNQIDPNDTTEGIPTLNSTGFVYLGYTCYFDDDGKGNVRIYRLNEGKKIFLTSTVGTIDYGAGKLQLFQFLPMSIVGNLPYIELSVRPLKNDIATKNDQLLIIDEPSIFIDMEDEAELIKK